MPRAQHQQEQQQPERSYVSILKEVASSLNALIQSELRLAKVELSRNVRDVGRQGAQVVAFGTVAWLGMLCLAAFLILGLGRLLGDRYWLSALIIGSALFFPFVLLTLSSLRRIGEDLKLQSVQENLSEDRELLSEKVQEISEVRPLSQRRTRDHDDKQRSSFSR